jgi:hypothetical protein
MDETAFVKKFRELLNQSGYKTSVLLETETPNRVVIYYGDEQKREVHQFIKNQFLTVEKTSFLSPKQASMVL